MGGGFELELIVGSGGVGWVAMKLESSPGQCQRGLTAP